MTKLRKRRSLKKKMAPKKGALRRVNGPWKLADPPKLILSEGEQRELLGIILWVANQKAKQPQPVPQGPCPTCALLKRIVNTP